MYKEIGGAPVIERLVEDFYHIMQTDPRAQHCLATHEGRDFKESSRKLIFFLSGWLGGPQLYLENYGHPRLRMRHQPFSISEVEAEEWLYCMDEALKRSSISNEHKTKLMEGFTHVAQMLIR